MDPTAQQVPPRIHNAAPRAIDDRLGEVLRRYHHGLIMPLWEDLDEERRGHWRDTVPAFLTMLASVGLKVEVKP